MKRLDFSAEIASYYFFLITRIHTYTHTHTPTHTNTQVDVRRATPRSESDQGRSNRGRGRGNYDYSAYYGYPGYPNYSGYQVPSIHSYVSLAASVASFGVSHFNLLIVILIIIIIIIVFSLILLCYFIMLYCILASFSTDARLRLLQLLRRGLEPVQPAVRAAVRLPDGSSGSHSGRICRHSRRQRSRCQPLRLLRLQQLVQPTRCRCVCALCRG